MKNAPAPLMADPFSRQAVSKKLMAEVGARKAALATIAVQASDSIAALKPFDDAKGSSQDAEMRTFLRTLAPDERRKAIATNVAAQRAVLGADPLLSGLDAIAHRELRDRLISEKYSEQVREAEAALEQYAMTRRYLDTAGEMLAQEYIAAGGQMTEPTPAEPWITALEEKIA